MSAAKGKVGNVVVLGVQGSGKTVFLSILGHTFGRGGAYGLQLTADNKTWDYVSDAYKRMRIDYEWPDSTNRGDFVELSWEVKDGTTPLFTINSIDCAGEEIVDALAPSSAGRGKDAGRKARSGEQAVGDSWDADEDGGGERDVRKLIAERVANASVICLFINPSDFESRIYGGGDDVGSAKEIGEAINRSKDMRRMLLTFLNAGAPAGAKRIILTITQSGRKEVSNLIDELGGTKTYLVEQEPEMTHWSGTDDAHIIAVSAVNKVVFKKKDGELVEPESVEGLDPETIKDDFVVRDPWVGTRDRKLHVVPREKPDVSGENPSSGLVEFILAVGGPLTPEIRPLDEALHRLRERQFAMSRARRDGGATAKERLAAADALDSAWQTFAKLSEAFVREKEQRRGCLRATERYLDEEESQLLRWIVAEREIDRFLRERAAAGVVPQGAAASVVTQIGKALESAWIRGAGRHRHCSCMAATGYDLSLTDSWLAEQFSVYREKRAQAIRDFEAAVKGRDAAAAQEALDELIEWGTDADATRPRQRLQELFAFLASLAERRKVIHEAELALHAAEIRLADARRLLKANDFAEARSAVAAARDAAGKEEMRARPLEGEKDRFGDGDAVDALLERARGLIRESEALIDEIVRSETEFGIAKELGKVDDDLAAATQAADSAEAFCGEGNFAVARQRVSVAQGHLQKAEQRLGQVALLPANERMASRKGAIQNGISGCTYLMGEIARLEQRRRKLRRIMRLAALAVAAAIALSFWLNARADEAARLRGRWESALKDARNGDYAVALTKIRTIQDKPALLLSRGSFVDPGDFERIKVGGVFKGGKRRAEEAKGKLGGHAGRLANAGLSGNDAPAEWAAYQTAMKNAEAMFPRPDLDDRLQLPKTIEEMGKAEVAYVATCEAAAEAEAAFEAFLETARRNVDIRKKKERIDGLRRQLEAAAPHGWEAMAQALPKGGADALLDLDDAQLEKLWNSVLSAGNDRGAPQPIHNAAGIKAEFERIKGLLSEDEWKANFAAIETNCLVVLDAAEKIDEERKRREWVTNSLNDAEDAVGRRQWDSAHSAVTMAKAKLSDDRKADAAGMSRAAEIEERIKKGRGEDHLKVLQELLKPVTPPQGWKAMAEALPKGGADSWLDLGEDQLGKAWNGVLLAGLKRPKGTSAPILDVQKTRAAFDQIRASATNDEWNANFAALEKDCSAVLEAAEKIDAELARRREIRDCLDSAQNHVDNGAWESAETDLARAETQISEDRKVDEEARNKAKKLRQDIEDGRARESESNYVPRQPPYNPVLPEQYGDGDGAADVDDGARSGSTAADAPAVPVPGDDEFGKEVAKLCPEYPPVAAPDWTALTDLAKKCVERHPESTALVAGRLAGWADSWINTARDKSLAASGTLGGTSMKSVGTSSGVGRVVSVNNNVSKKTVEALWKNVKAAEGLLDRAAACWRVFEDSGLTSPKGNLGDWIAKVRDSLPPVLCVSLYESSYDQGNALDAYALVASPKKDHCGELPNPETGKRDLLVATASEGGVVSLRFSVDEPWVSRPISFSWHGSRHAAATVKSNEVKFLFD